MVSKSTSSKAANQSFTMEDFAQALEEHSYDFSKGQVVSGKVHSHESEGAYIDIGGKSLALVPLQEAFVGEIGELSIALPLEEERNFLIVREQNRDGEILLSVRQLEIKKIWDKLTEQEKEGQSFPVRVTGTNKGGVTVDIESMRGFVPRSHLLQKENLEALVGELLTVNFLELDRDRNKIVLSQRLATQSAGFSELEIGQLVDGKISSIKPFGVFVDLDNGITGLLHITQISQKRVESLPDLVGGTKFIKAMIVDLEEGRKRISLSTRVLENYPGEMIENFEAVMESAEARAERARKGLLQLQ